MDRPPKSLIHGHSFPTADRIDSAARADRAVRLDQTAGHQDSTGTDWCICSRWEARCAHDPGEVPRSRSSYVDQQRVLQVDQPKNPDEPLVPGRKSGGASGFRRLGYRPPGQTASSPSGPLWQRFGVPGRKGTLLGSEQPITLRGRALARHAGDRCRAGWSVAMARAGPAPSQPLRMPGGIWGIRLDRPAARLGQRQGRGSSGMMTPPTGVDRGSGAVLSSTHGPPASRRRVRRMDAGNVIAQIHGGRSLWPRPPPSSPSDARGAAVPGEPEGEATPGSASPPKRGRLVTTDTGRRSICPRWRRLTALAPTRPRLTVHHRSATRPQGSAIYQAYITASSPPNPGYRDFAISAERSVAGGAPTRVSASECQTIENHRASFLRRWIRRTAGLQRAGSMPDALAAKQAGCTNGLHGNGPGGQATGPPIGCARCPRNCSPPVPHAGGQRLPVRPEGTCRRVRR